MAKEPKRNSNLKVAGFVLSILLVLGAVGASYWDHKADVKVLTTEVNLHGIQQDKDMATIKGDGCAPSQKNTTSVAVIESRLTNIEKAQTDNTAAIIKAINDKK